MPQAIDPKKVDASPSKQLFIEMLTRDVLLIPAILDVADNCVDGARKIRPDGNFKKLYIEILLGEESFSIKDNCGGIEADIARKYAFRFGRDTETPLQNHSIGRFGVGLKRAIFKMGSAFDIQSIAPKSSFTMEVDVIKWSKTKEWAFEFSTLDEDHKNKIDATGTTLKIAPLHTEVSAAFSVPTFSTELASEITTKLQEALRHGLNISVNGVPIHADTESLVSEPKLAPVEFTRTFKSPGEKPVKLKLVCGLGSSADRESAGWHVYCNGRAVLNGDKSAITGWGYGDEDVFIPGFHPQYNLFRGYAYFDSDDAGLLPWNTSKTAINADSVIYQAALLDMIRVMRPVIDFCNQLKSEKEQREDQTKGPLEKLVDGAQRTPIPDVKTRPVFTIPAFAPIPKKTGPVLQRIQYDRPLKNAEAVRKALNVGTWKEVGERTFEYFYNNEVK